MTIKGRRFLTVAGVLGACLTLSPAMAQHGGGGHGGGGHAGGGGHFGGGHAAVGHAGFAHFGGGGHYAGGRVGGAPAAHYGAGAVHGYGSGGYGGHAAYGYPSGGYRRGYSTGAYWGGGYWRGGFWPRAYYGLGYAWFLPILPLAYATYWYGGTPYYYANDVYYTWNPDYNGYTATDPPPVTDSSADGSAAPADAPPPSAQSFADPGAGPGGQIFMYPKNGQSEAQQSTDKRECQQWAASQAGAANSADYRRAMTACIEGRGYSAK